MLIEELDNLKSEKNQSSNEMEPNYPNIFFILLIPRKPSRVIRNGPNVLSSCTSSCPESGRRCSCCERLCRAMNATHHATAIPPPKKGTLKFHHGVGSSGIIGKPVSSSMNNVSSL